MKGFSSYLTTLHMCMLTRIGATIPEILVILEIQSYNIKMCMDSEMLIL